jgi:nicotinate dehydrogenase subunit B
MSTMIGRGNFLKSSGFLLIAFSMEASRASAATPDEANPLGVVDPKDLDSWLAIDADGHVTALCGKVELGTGIETALTQIVADELDVPFGAVHVIQGRTGVTPDQGYTAGSKSLQVGAPPLRRAAAEARVTLLGIAAQRLGVDVAALVARDGRIALRDPAGSQAPLSYGELLNGQRFSKVVDPAVALKPVADYAYVGKPLARLDIPAKVYGTFEYIQNVRVPGMWHARVVRPMPVGSHFVRYDPASLAGIPGVRVVQVRDFVAVAAADEWAAIRAARALKVTWKGGGLPNFQEQYTIVRNMPSEPKVVIQRGDPVAGFAKATRTLHATYHWPYQTHGSIGPSCAIADVHADRATIWSPTQGVYPLRDALAELLGLGKAAVHVVYAEGAGCYGHNGADDVCGDAALVSKALRRPIRVQWMRQDEHGWDPKGAAMVIDARAGLDAGGNLVAWQYDAFTPTHSTRPDGKAGNLLAGQFTGKTPNSPFVGGDRNARSNYAFADQRVTAHVQKQWILRPSALRSLGAAQNTFANESFVDEVAHAAGADPIAFRLRHLDDARAKDVLEAVAKLAKWEPGKTLRSGSGDVHRGRGVALTRYENVNAAVAVIADCDVNKKTGAIHVRDVYVAHDCGLIVNPDGLRNQLEGNVIQASSRTLKEEIRYDRQHVTTLDWASYPIIRFTEVPNVHITLIDRPELPSLGAGEPTTAVIAPAIANAVFAAVGARCRTVPLTPERVLAALHPV